MEINQRTAQRDIAAFGVRAARAVH
jgi:hypothetical protein